MPSTCTQQADGSPEVEEGDVPLTRHRPIPSNGPHPLPPHLHPRGAFAPPESRTTRFCADVYRLNPRRVVPAARFSPPAVSTLQFIFIKARKSKFKKCRCAFLNRGDIRAQKSSGVLTHATFYLTSPYPPMACRCAESRSQSPSRVATRPWSLTSRRRSFRFFKPAHLQLQPLRPLGRDVDVLLQTVVVGR